jgi:hypothetical protein
LVYIPNNKNKKIIMNENKNNIETHREGSAKDKREEKDVILAEDNNVVEVSVCYINIKSYYFNYEPRKK